jgi:uncharacterized membrane protein YukC
MRPETGPTGDGIVKEVLPLIKDGLVIFRSILDTMIDRIEEVEMGRDTDARGEIYSSIIDVIEAEIENIEKSGPETATSRAKIEALEAAIAALLDESDKMEAEAEEKKKKGKRKKDRRPKKVKID